MIDFHSHVLPGIDDGAESVNESIKMLETSYSQGVSAIVATPHFYSEHMSVEGFLKHRNASYMHLKNHIDANCAIPDIVLGSEVHMGANISKLAGLEKLCIGNSKCILLELPYAVFSEWMLYEINNIIIERGLFPVLAHLDRYIISTKNISQFNNLFKLNVGIQFNQEAFKSFSKRRIVKNVMQEYYLKCFIGSDCHNITSRVSDMERTANIIRHKFGKTKLEELMDNAKDVLEI